MRRLFLIVLTALVAAVLPAAAAPTIAGTWHTISDVDGKPRGIIRITEAAGRIEGVAAGTLVPGERMDALCVKCKGERANKPVNGMVVLWNLKRDPKDPLTYSGGQVLDPDNGNIYSARVKLSPDGQALTLRGYIGNPMLGRSQTWKRAQ